MEKIAVVDVSTKGNQPLLVTDEFLIEKNRILKNSNIHYHTCYEFEIVLDGKTKTQINNEIFEGRRGNFWISLPNDVHVVKLDGGEATILNIKFEEGLLPGNMYDFFDVVQSRLYGSLTQKQLEDFLEFVEFITKSHLEMRSEFNKKNFGKSFIRMLLSYIADACEENTKSFEDVISEGKIFEAIDYIKKNFKRQITIGEVSLKTGYTPNYFSTKFKEITGRSFVDFVNEERLRCAYYLLSSTNMNVGEVAEYVGYDTISYFSKMFKKYYFIPPSKVRNIC